MSRHEHLFSDQGELINALSNSIMSDLEQAIDEKGKASLLVSGGSTPKPLFETLSQTVFTWEKVNVSLCDERWVEPSQQESNEHFVKTFLLKDEAKKANFISMYASDTNIEDAEKSCSNRLKEKLMPIDVLILGMGGDAHTASLFPNNVKLEEAFDLAREDLCIAIEPDSAPFMRMSLTPRALLSARHIYLHFEGEEKRIVYEKAINGEDKHEMPIRSVLNQKYKDIEVFYR